MNVTPSLITSLTENECFVFGSNLDGFHGAGAAGYAFRGDASNTWRQDSFFIKAMSAPPLSEVRIGKWAIYGVARGYQRGREGASYAIPTVTKPGRKRSIPLADIQRDVDDFIKYAIDHPDVRFYVTELGCNLAGWTPSEIASLFGMPNISNISLPKSFLDALDKTI